MRTTQISRPDCARRQRAFLYAAIARSLPRPRIPHRGQSLVIRVCLAGATGWAGSELARGIAWSADLKLVAAVARRHVGKVLGEVLDEPQLSVRVSASA